MNIHLIPLLAVSSILILSCSSGVEEPFTKTTVPVIGKVTVDGQEPGGSIQIKCFNKGETDQEHPTVSGGFTKKDGSFELSTYTTGDGLPVGDYTLTFVWKKLDLMTRSYGGPDKLKKRYDDPKKSKIEVSVKESEAPIDMGVIELKTK